MNTAPVLPVAFHHAPRPTPRGIDVVTTLADFAIVTFDVEPEALAAHLPPGFEPDVFRLDDGRERAFVSAVPFRDLDFRFHFAPWCSFRFPQTNYRAYVRRRQERCVWFFGTTLDTVLVGVPRVLWKLPWRQVRTTLEARWTGDRLDGYALESKGAWGGASLRIESNTTPLRRLDGFPDVDSGAFVLTHPLVGYMRGLDGRLTTYSVWHDRLDVQHVTAAEARFDVFEQLGLVMSGQQPHSVLVQRETEFVIRLPPRALSD